MPHKLQFRVIHASGQDDNFKASELNSHGPLTKGWVSSRFCLYPQDIVIQLTDRSRIKKIQILSHQYLIATKIEFFVGDIPDGMPFALEQARYQRLGYVSLSDNEKTGFKARELKSVHVDATGQLLRLNVHKNHINKFNLYNQVGVVAINVIGDRMNKPYEIADQSMLELEDNRQNEADSIYNKPDYISPLDDLAFDMYQDPEVAQIIRKLELKKQEAVLQERYDYAKKLKVAVTELQKVGEKLGKMEVEKRQAVENEDYDKAKLKKVQMDEYRLQMYKDLNIRDLLELQGNRHPQPIHFEPARQPTPPRLAQISPPPSQRSPPPKMPYDDRPLPVNKNLPPSLSARLTEEGPVQAIAVKPNRPPPEEEEPELPSEGEPEPLTEKDLREASTAIDVFGEPLVSKAYSKTWSYREDSLLAVYKQLQELPATAPKDEARNMMRAATFLCKRAIDDKVYAVFKAGLSLEKMILTEYIPKHKLSRSDTVYLVDNTLPALLHKAGDTAQRNRDDARKFVLSMANFPEVKPTHAVPNECTKPIKPTMAPRLAQSRAEITESLYKEHGLNSGLTRDHLMKFSVKTLDHTAGEVREVGERIIKSLYHVEGAKIKEYLPPDTEKTRKNTLYRQLFEYFDQVDGKPSKDDLKKKKADEESRKQAEIEQLQKQLQQLKDMASGKAPVDEQVISGNKNTKAAPAKKPDTKPKPKPKAPPPKASEEDDISMLNMDNVCIFCAEHDATFTEEGLDLHYWKSCPMLKRCANCKQVVEISGYTDHLLNECEAKSNFAKCPRCQEAISKVEYDQHVADKACNPAKPNMFHCPLCHTNLTTGDDSWNTHLMDRTNGCKNNPRRLLAQNEPANTGKGGTQNKAKGKAGPIPRAPNPGKSMR